MEPRINIYSSPQKVAEAFAQMLESLINRDQKINIALSGGSTPKLLFDHLSENFADKWSWNNVHFFWGDERCVPPDDGESNFKMANDLLFKNIELPQENIHRIRGEDDPKEEAERYAEEISEQLSIVKGIPRFGLVILGMGSDGHTASIFPNQMELLSSEKICEVATHPESGQKRITITGQVINYAARVVFLVTGESKAKKVSEIIQQKENRKDYPAAHISPLNGTLDWYLDEAAAKRINHEE